MSGLVVFDCDGTLVDSQHAIIAAVRQAFGHHGLPLPADEAVRRIVGLSLPDALERLAGAECDVSPEALSGSYRKAFMNLRQQGGSRNEALFPGIRECLDELGRHGFVLGVATGKSDRGLAATLAHHGIAACFASTHTADRHPSKPHPSMLEAVMADVGATPDETVVVGDTSYDILMARHAGARGLGVGWGYHPPQELRDAGAVDVAPDAGGLAGLLKDMYRQVRHDG